VQTRSPGGAIQWIPADGQASNMVPDAFDPTKRHAPIMFTTDLSLKFDPSYREIALRFKENPEEYQRAFAKAWFKLTHRDLGPRARYWLAIFANCLALAFASVLFVLCTEFWWQAWSNDWHSDTVWRAPLWVPYFSMPVGLGLLVLQYIADLLSIATGRMPPFQISHEEHVA